jgi:hypothetical protein
MLSLTGYLIAGALIFFSLRTAFKKLKLNPRPHDKIWTLWFCAGRENPEAWAIWILSILAWPLYAAASIIWMSLEFFHLGGKRDAQRRDEIASAEETKYDHLTLDQKIELLKAEAKKHE